MGRNSIEMVGGGGWIAIHAFRTYFLLLSYYKFFICKFLYMMVYKLRDRGVYIFL